MTYFQGFLVPVKTGDRQAYLNVAREAAPFFAEYGATRTVECWGDDVMRGQTTDLWRAVDAQDGENVVFSWVFWPDKATCDAAAGKMMTDDRMKPPADMPFDGKRLVYGGFEVAWDSGDRGPFGYVDGMVAAVPDGERAAYTGFVRDMGERFLKLGATRAVDGWGADVPDGKVTDFKRAVQARPGETIVFGWMEWPDKGTRDAGMAAVMQDPEITALKPVWNGALAIFGGFAPILDTDHA